MAAFEERRAEGFFQLNDALADRRLRRAEFARGGGKASEPRGGLEHR